MIRIDSTPDATLTELRALLQQVGRTKRPPVPETEPGGLADNRMMLMANNLFEALCEVQPDHPLVQEYRSVWWRKSQL